MDISTLDNFKKYFDYQQDTASIIFDYSNNKTESIRGTLHKWGLKQLIENKWNSEKYNKLRELLSTPDFNSELLMIHDVPIEDVFKMVNCTGWVGTWWENKNSIKADFSIIRKK